MCPYLKPLLHLKEMLFGCWIWWQQAELLQSRLDCDIVSHFTCAHALQLLSSRESAGIGIHQWVRALFFNQFLLK